MPTTHSCGRVGENTCVGSRFDVLVKVHSLIKDKARTPFFFFFGVSEATSSEVTGLTSALSEINVEFLGPSHFQHHLSWVFVAVYVSVSCLYVKSFLRHSANEPSVFYQSLTASSCFPIEAAPSFPPGEPVIPIPRIFLCF